MKNVRKILAAVLAVMMVLAMMPAAFAATGNVYVLDTTADLPAVAPGEKEAGAELVAGTDNYFTLIFSAKTKIDSSNKTFEDGYVGAQRFNYQGKTEFLENGPQKAIKFTTSAAATIKLWWVSAGDGREMAIYDAEGNIVDTTDPAASVKDSKYISELKVEAAGTYYLGVPTNSNYLFKAEVTEAAAAAPATPAEILAAAYALEQGASFPEAATLTGTIVNIKDAYSEKFGNISVVIAVEGSEDLPMLCYRLKGGAELKVGDVITVTGSITNYKGTIEFNSGCTYTLDKAGKTPAEIIEAAYALEQGASFEGKASLTGTIVNIKDAYSEKFNNVSFNISVEGCEDKPMLCYRVKGGADLKAGDIVTVTGIITNYKGTIEFNSGGTFYMVKAAPAADPETPSDPGEVTVPATLAEQIAEANKLANNALLPYESTITGTITDEPQASSKTEGCYKFTVSDGTNSLLCYFVPVTGGTPKQGDTVTVTGKLTAYNGKAQFSEKNSTAALAAPSGDTYTVKAGDTLAKIALTHYGTVYAYKAIFEANSDILENPNLIRVGQVLTLPSEGKLVPAETETLYTVQPGDTLAKIALAHYGSASQYKVIFERNSAHLSNPNLIFVGQVLVLPAK